MANVLIVDDDADIAETLMDVLGDHGYKARVARNGRDGLALLQAQVPDLVVLDVEMPELDGPDMVEAMFMHNKGLEKVPVILCSGVLDLASVASKVGTPYFLPKPYSLEAILGLIARVLREKQPARPVQQGDQP